MKKTDLIEALAAREDLDISKAKAKELLTAVLEEITNGLIEDGEVQITGFGTFRKRHVAAREGRNPRQPEETIMIPAREQVSFSAGTNLKKDVNGLNGDSDTGRKVRVVE